MCFALMKKGNPQENGTVVTVIVQGDLAQEKIMLLQSPSSQPKVLEAKKIFLRIAATIRRDIMRDSQRGDLLKMRDSVTKITITARERLIEPELACIKYLP
jgi:hypothetical protein